MKPFLFLNLGLIFSSSILLVVLLFFNCLNEAHFAAVFSVGFVTSLLISFSSYKPNSTLFVLYFGLAFCSFAFLIFQVTMSGFVYSFSEESRAVFIERDVRDEMKRMPLYAIKSEGKYGTYANVCASPPIASFPLAVEAIYKKESCVGPLGFLLFDENYLSLFYSCNADEENWVVEETHPNGEGYLCIDKSRIVFANEKSIGEALSCR